MSGAPVKEKHRELAEELLEWRPPPGVTGQSTLVTFAAKANRIAQAIADAEARGYEAGIREVMDVWGDHWDCSANPGHEGFTAAILALLPEVTK